MNLPETSCRNTIGGYTGWGVGHVYFNGSLLAEYNRSATPTVFVHGDHLGSTRLVTTMSQSIYDNMDYLPFGEQIAGASGSTHKFTGDERDSETNLDHTWFRQYSSQLGRWMTPDPAGRKAVRLSNPQSWNRYVNVLNSPMNAVDPLGLGLCDVHVYDYPGCIGGPGGFPGGGTCMVDFGLADCGEAFSIVSSGAGVQCPNNACNGINSHGKPVYFWAPANGPGNFYTFSGPGALYYSVNQAGIAAGKLFIAASVAIQREFFGTVSQDANGVFTYNQQGIGPPSGPTVDCESTILAGGSDVAIWHTHPIPNDIVQFLGDRIGTVPYPDYVTNNSGTFLIGAWGGGGQIIGPAPSGGPQMLDYPQIAPICQLPGGSSFPGISRCQ